MRAIMRFPVAVLMAAVVLGACGGAAAPSLPPAPASSPAAKPSAAASAAASAKPAASASAKPAASAAASAKPAGSAAAAGGAKVKVGGQGLIGDAALWVGLDKAFFKEQGMDLELVPFTSTADILPSLTSGQVDFSTTAANAAMFNATERDIQIKFVSNMAVASPQTKSAGIGIRKDLLDSGKFKSAADLKGLNIASGGPPGASTIDVAIEKYAVKGGLSHADLKLNFLPFPQ